ncbi:MAG: hypothetical protein J6Y19_08375, partial [Kiritimatiellae bacterium]|nr:hypothetical protein [Kiritimatiellia bacterium]
IDFNNIAKPSINATPAALPDAAADKKPLASPRDLTITQAKASAEDIAAASIPDSALTRTDPLGLLVSSAFDLPPPPMPDFSRA